MAIEYVCRWCGFVFYKGNKPRSTEDIVKQWGGRCPRCLSPIPKIPQRVEVIFVSR